MSDKLAGIAPGDRVRVTIEGVAKHTDQGTVSVYTEAGSPVVYATADEVDSPAFQIERIEPPLKVGDRIAFKVNGSVGVLLGVNEQKAWVRYEDGCYAMPPLSDLERIP